MLVQINLLPLPLMFQHQLSELCCRQLLHCIFGLCQQDDSVEMNFQLLIEKPTKRESPIRNFTKFLHTEIGNEEAGTRTIPVSQSQSNGPAFFS